MKKNKLVYCDKYSERNWNNIKTIWKGIKSLISLKTVAYSVPTVLSLNNGNTITILYDIANIFNNYLASMTETTKKSQNSCINVFHMKVVVQHLCNLMIKKK